MKQYIGGILLGVMLVILMFPSETLAKASPMLSPYRIEDRVLQGTAEANESIYLYLDGRIHTVQTDDTGRFTLPLQQAIGMNNVSILLLDQWGYKESMMTFGPENPTTEAMRPAPKVNFVGQTEDGSFYLTTAYDATIYAVYEGKLYTGNQELVIPKGTATELRVYAKSVDGIKGDTVVLSTATTPKISVNVYDFQTKRFTGTAWPYAVLTFKNEAAGGEWTTLADEKGRFTLDYTSNLEALQEEQTLRVLSEGKVSVETTATLPAYHPSATTAYYVLVEENQKKVIGMTYPNTTILLDKTMCATSDAAGYFECDVQGMTEPLHELSFQREKETVSTLVELPANLQDFPLTLDRPISSEHPILSGKTLPNRRFLVNADGLSFPLMSDATGRFTTTLPKQYKGTVYLSLRSLNGMDYPLRTWTIQDERPLLRPTMRLSGSTLELTNPMKDLPTVKGEIILEHTDGSFDAQSFTFLKRSSYEQARSISIEGVKPGDRYTMTLMTDETNVRKATFEGTLQPLTEITLHPFGPYDRTLTGTGEPGTAIKLEMPIAYASHVNDGTEIFEGTVAKDSTFVLKSRYTTNSKTWAVHYSGVMTIYITRPGTQDALNYSIPLEDQTPPTITMPKIRDTIREFSYKSDDILKTVEVRYYQGQTLIKTVKKTLNWYTSDRYYTNVWEGKSLKQDGITKIEMRGTNKANLTSNWVEKPVLNTTFPSLVVSEVLYGDKTIRIKTTPQLKVKASIGNQTYDATADASGIVDLRLKRPIAPEDYMISFTFKNKAGDTKTIEKKPLDYPVQDIHWNEKKNKVWFVTQDTHLRPSRYTFKVNGKEVKLTGTRPRSVFTLPTKVKAPFQVELTLRNTDGTVRSTMKKTIRTSYENKKVTKLTASAKTGWIKGIAQPYHLVEAYDDNDLNLAGIVLYQDQQFSMKAYRALRIGKTITIHSRDPFGQTSIVSLKIKDDIAPKAPTVSRITSKSTRITGKTEAKAHVVVTYKKKTYRTQADTKGNYVLRISSWKAGETISIYAEDATKNRSDKTVTKIVK